LEDRQDAVGQTTGYQSEAQLEELLVKDLERKRYERVEIRDKDELKADLGFRL